MNPLLLFVIGSIGASAPEILRLYSLRNDPEKFRWSWFYLIVSSLFALMGGLVALVLPATTYWGAFYVGISTPVLVSTALKKGIETKQVQLKSASTAQTLPYSLMGSFLRGI